MFLVQPTWDKIFYRKGRKGNRKGRKEEIMIENEIANKVKETTP